MIKHQILLVFLALICFFGYSQKTLTNSSSVVVHDPMIEKLIEFHKNACIRDRCIQGYRVHIYIDAGIRSKLRTDNAKSEFDEKYPNVSSYITYDEPNYRIRVGDFRTRLDATRFLNSIKKEYPAAYIVPEKINYPDFN